MALLKRFCLFLLLLSVGCTTQTKAPAIKAGAAAGKFPGHSLSSPMLQRDTLSQLIVTDKIAAGAAQVKCQDRTVVNTEVIEQPQDVRREGKRLLQGRWTERWTLDRCGSLVLYRVAYSADGKSGISYEVTPDR
jgi:hypothetical protein